LSDHDGFASMEKSRAGSIFDIVKHSFAIQDVPQSLDSSFFGAPPPWRKEAARNKVQLSCFFFTQQSDPPLSPAAAAVSSAAVSSAAVSATAAAACAAVSAAAAAAAAFRGARHVLTCDAAGCQKKRKHDRGGNRNGAPSNYADEVNPDANYESNNPKDQDHVWTPKMPETEPGDPDSDGRANGDSDVTAVARRRLLRRRLLRRTRQRCGALRARGGQHSRVHRLVHVRALVHVVNTSLC
jgi:hypothetical protein